MIYESALKLSASQTNSLKASLIYVQLGAGNALTVIGSTNIGQSFRRLQNTQPLSS